MKYILTGFAALLVIGAMLFNGCASKPPHRSEIQVTLLQNGNIQISKKSQVSVAALPKALKKIGAYPDTAILVLIPPNTPEATRKQIGRVLLNKGLSAPIFVGPKRAKSGLAPTKR